MGPSNTTFDHNSNIKRLVRKLLKQRYPNWNNLNRKNKKEILLKVLAEVAINCDFEQEVTTLKEELLGIDQQVPSEGILNLDEMAAVIL